MGSGPGLLAGGNNGVSGTPGFAYAVGNTDSVIGIAQQAQTGMACHARFNLPNALTMAHMVLRHGVGPGIHLGEERFGGDSHIGTKAMESFCFGAGRGIADKTSEQGAIRGGSMIPFGVDPGTGSHAVPLPFRDQEAEAVERVVNLVPAISHRDDTGGGITDFAEQRRQFRVEGFKGRGGGVGAASQNEL